MLSDSQLQQIMPTLPAAKRDQYLPFINAIMPMYEIDSPLREAAFIAQIAHESGELKFWEEIWGPTAAQKRYEPPSDLAARLGNTQPGDGKRYRGRGPIQITGRSNYRKYGSLVGFDLEGNPDLAATTQVGLQVAGEFWRSNGLNELADAQDFTNITKRINGGLNGLASRQKYYETAKRVLGVSASFGSFTARAVSRGAMASALADSAPDAPAPVPPASLPRGQEAIEEIIGNAPTGDAPKPAAKKKSAPGLAKKTSGVVAAKKAVSKSAKKSSVKVAAKKTAPAKKAATKVAAKKAAKKPPAKKASTKVAAKTLPAKKAATKSAKKSAKKS